MGGLLPLATGGGVGTARSPSRAAGAVQHGGAPPFMGYVWPHPRGSRAGNPARRPSAEYANISTIVATELVATHGDEGTPHLVIRAVRSTTSFFRSSRASPYHHPGSEGGISRGRWRGTTLRAAS
jgi:hypothetical protein